MELATIYSIAKRYKSYSEFKSRIDELMTGTPQTVVSDNEFKLVLNQPKESEEKERECKGVCYHEKRGRERCVVFCGDSSLCDEII